MRYRGAVARYERIARFVATGVVLGWLAFTLTSWFITWKPEDANAYYLAAERLRDGGMLYPAMNPEAHEVFRYAPWFAVAWLPFTLLPMDFVSHAWSLAMLACSFLAVWPVARLGGRAAFILAALLLAPLAETAMFGNAHPLVVAVLTWTITRRSAAIWVGIATSVKLVPIFLAAGWLGLGRWRDALIATSVAVVLFAPMLLFDLSDYSTTPGSGLFSLYAVNPFLWLVVALASLGAIGWLAWRGSPYVYLAAGIGMFLIPPRVSTAYAAFLIPGLLATIDALERRVTSPARVATAADAIPDGQRV
jgi:hypothetical protein